MEQQLADFVFTVRGHAYQLEDAFMHRSIPMVVTAKSPSSTPWKSKGTHLGGINYPDIIDHHAEGKAPGPHQSSYVVIGVVPRSTPTDEELNKIAKRGIIGATHPAVYVTPLQGKLALRVVTPKTLEPPIGGLKLYVLTDKDESSGLCNAYNIAQDHVYYFSEYRTSSNKVPERKRQWNELVANYSVGHLAPVTQSRQHALAGPAALDDSVQSVAKEISMIVRSHELAHNRTERERLMTLLKSAEFRSPEFTLLMDQFFSPDASIPELSKEEALELELLIKQTWPCLRWVTAERLSLLQKGIREASVTISSADSYSFISFGCFHLINNKDAKKFILELFPQIQSTTETESQDVPPPLRSKSKVSNMLKAIATRLKDILNTSLVTLHEIDQRHGNMVISLPPELVYQRLSHVTDVNSLRSLMDQAVRYSIREPQKQLDRVCNISKSLLDHIGQTVAELDGDAAST